MIRAIRRCCGLAGRFRKCQDGATAIEFAMVGAPFLYMLLMIFELAIMLFTDYVIEQGVADASREIRTGQVRDASTTQDEFKQMICGKLSGFLQCDTRLSVDVRSWSSFAAISQPSATQTTAGDTTLSADVTTNSQFSTGAPMQVETVKTYYAYPLYLSLSFKLDGKYIGLANLSGNKRLLTAGAVFRNEPFQ